MAQNLTQLEDMLAGVGAKIARRRSLQALLHPKSWNKQPGMVLNWFGNVLHRWAFGPRANEAVAVLQRRQPALIIDTVYSYAD